MRKILIFEPFLSGHRLEYIHHLHEGAAKNPTTHYYFAVSDQFADLKGNYIWSEADNITFLYMDAHYIQSVQCKRKIDRIFSLIGQASKFSKQHEVDEIFFISMAEYMPWLPFFLRGGAQISGIIYYIYLYEWKSKGMISRMKDAITMLSTVLIRKYKHIFILNDPIAATYLNKKFGTKKFHCLPDPYLPLTDQKTNNKSLKERFGIGDEKKIFLHFGSMSYRKGTMNILQAIALLSKVDLNDRCFVFAGIVNNDIKEQFYTLTDALKEQTEIFVFDTFCDPSFLTSLCKACSVILAPYYNTANSSGIIGYAANWNKPVVVPDEKFLGKLVKRYRLGYLIKDNSPESIAGFIKNSSTFPAIDGTDYLNSHTIHDFVQKTRLFD